jgi:tRNA (guanine-N7-)-methyltransferase
LFGGFANPRRGSETYPSRKSSRAQRQLNCACHGSICPVIELIPKSYCARLDVEEIFGRVAPLQVDLGCGDGSFVCEMAGRMPGTNFLGIERLTGRVLKAGRRGARMKNLRVLRVETLYAVEYLLPPQSVEVFHLLFPDPWPKRRHHHRRLVTERFLTAISAALIPDGILRIVTDQRDYFDVIQQLAGRSADFASTEITEQFPASTFEKHFLRLGAPIHRLVLRKFPR